MTIKEYQAFTHGTYGQHDEHVDVRITFDGKPTIKMCGCSAYMGVVGAFGEPSEIAGKVRADLGAMTGKHDLSCYIDVEDGSVDIYEGDTLMFSMEAEKLEGADWLPTYSSEEGAPK